MLDLGAQGGSHVGDVQLDLSTCLNGYGPAPAALQALRTATAQLVKQHPYDACEYAEAVFAEHFSVSSDFLVAVRGASEAIWQLASVTDGMKVALPMPAYTEFRKWFPNAELIPGKVHWHTVEQLSSAASGMDVVLFSNPQNPTGRFLTRWEIEDVANRNPETLFVVDSSYAEFTLPDQHASMIGCEAENVAVITSPTKFFGIGGVRVGAVWSRNSDLLQAFRALRSNWPLSSIDVSIVEAAYGDDVWVRDVRSLLHADGLWLEEWLLSQPGLNVTPGPLQFRLVEGKVVALRKKLLERGIATRLLTEAHGFERPVMRISAPTESQRHLLP